MSYFGKSLTLGGMLVASLAWQAVCFHPSTALADRLKLQTAEALPTPGADQRSNAIADFLATDAIPEHKVHCLPIYYRAWAKNRCFRCASDKVTLLVEDPCCCGCYAKVPVCIPICCQGDPHVCAKSGVLGRRRVSFTWDCGFAVEVIFRTRGDLVVLY